MTKHNKSDASSVQIYDWQNNLFVAQRIFPNQTLIDIEFNPYKPLEVALVGVGMLVVLEIGNTVLIAK